MTEQYMALAKKILGKGEYEWNARTQTGTLSLFGESCNYDLRDGFPLVTTKDLAWRLPIEEQLFFLRGENNLGILLDKNVKIWNANGFDFYLRRNKLESEFPKHSPEWREKFKEYIFSVKNNPIFREKEGTLGRIYGVQARDWKGADGRTFDQLKIFLEKLKKDPSSRSNIVSHFNPAEMDQMALGPCHLLYQSRVIEDQNRLDLLMYQRSADKLLGVPFNGTQYSFLIELAAKELGMVPGKFSHHFGNVHYYIGTNPRSDFLRSSENLKEFQGKFNEVSKPEDYLELKEWYLNNAPRELKGTEGTDQIPFALIQLSRDIRKAPSLELTLEDFNFWEAIKMDAKSLVKINDYHPHEKLIYELDGKEIGPLIAA